ncbi:unnamed protein product [Rotaria sp. Silwood1]|nr:unnamed protein product [Rotaria sp. Silwood1]
MMSSILFIVWIVLFDRSLFVKTVFIHDSASQNEVYTNTVTLIEDTTIAEQTAAASSENNGEIDTPIPLTDDIIELNVGGQKITTLRSTLTVVPNSKLAPLQTTDTYLESDEDNSYEDVFDSTETNFVSNHTTSNGNTTKIYANTTMHNTSSSLDDDVIELNVSGERISTLRSTLTVVPNSKLAQMFTKGNRSVWQSRDKQNATFFDYNPVQFKYLLDQLRMIKRTPEIPPEEIIFQTPNADIQTNFSYMIVDLGLNRKHDLSILFIVLAERFLSPFAGAHVNLSISSLVGWRKCYRDTYDQPLDLSSLLQACRSRKILVACRPVGNHKTLTLAGVGKWQDLFRPCSSNTYCQYEMKNDIAFYYALDQAWGFEGRSQDIVLASNNRGHNYGSGSMSTISLNPCDTNDHYSEGRLCWSLRSNVNRGGGDRCGSMRNLHNAVDWERIVYQVV